ncbi:alkaline phosphatase D family protein [Prosthecobacter sp.]|uniref:alkaline phosphatase D family protein n=1 Tax=Prosthecobacter sp. TaxID=1965333 RepID=UPI003783CEA0
MKRNISRRTGLKLMTAGTFMGLSARDNAMAAPAKSAAATDAWAQTHDRVFLGGEYWANPMEDWRVSEGGAECLSMGGGRSVHSLTHQIAQNGEFTMGVTLTRLEIGKADGGAGFRVGIRSEINEYRSNCFVQKGINAGWQGDQLVLGPKNVPVKDGSVLKQLKLTLHGAAEGDKCVLTLTASAADSGAELGTVSHAFPANELLGNVSIANNFAAGAVAGAKKNKAKAGGTGTGRYRFQKWTMEGSAFTVSPQNQFGPLLWSMYSLSDSRTDEGFVMKLSALTAPLGTKDNQVVELLVKRGGSWKSLGESKLDPDAWVATFRIPRWNEKQSTPYKVVYVEKHTNGTETEHEWTGTIKPNPEGRPLRMAALTCQNDYGFPYAPVAENLVKLDPDLVFFSGDQIYENHGGFGIIREPAEPAILNYLRKFYQHGWAFREVMRNAPTLCLPDDHDVFQGNIWGEGGKKMDVGDTGASSKGGYIEPARMVNAVHKTNVAHHPDAYDPKPVLQDISVYYGDMVYGGVSFAIIADRQWKSGPEHVQTGGARADHVPDKNFDTSKLDKPGLVLLGERQEEFLKKWALDWRGHTLKAVLSQTIFANVATHHGGPDGYLKADLDSGGWPQTPRNRAVEIMRPSMALHINGDQHLTTMTQYGVDKQRDSNWSFCTPAISAGYPRWWRPDELKMPHENRPKHGLPDTGEFIDGLGNKAYVYAVGNPVVGQAPNRYEKAHEKGSGFGFITFDTEKRTYFIESFRFLIDATDGKPTNQFPGWPMTIQQKENRGENVIA